MKTLHLRRHSIKDGPDNTIGPKGLELAFNQGKTVNLDQVEPDIQDAMGGGHPRQFNRLFHGPLVRTAQTALAFCQGLGYMPKVMPVVNGLGDEALFTQMATHEFKIAVMSGLSNFAAGRRVHGTQAIIWAVQGRLALINMFNAMADDEVGLGFFHSPTIEFAAWRCGAEYSKVGGWDQLKDMEGLVFVCADQGEIRLTGKISVTTDTAK